MYNKYLYDDRDAFRDLYTYVSEDAEPEAEAAVSEAAPVPEDTRANPMAAVSGLMSRFNLHEIGIVPLVLLAFLLFDAEDDERLITIALAFILGL